MTYSSVEPDILKASVCLQASSKANGEGIQRTSINRGREGLKLEIRDSSFVESRKKGDAMYGGKDGERKEYHS